MMDADTFTDTLFSWSLEDILNEDFLKNKVEQIPQSFESFQHYFGSYVYPLLEETRTELCSSMEKIAKAPFAEVVSIRKLKQSGRNSHDGRKLYDVSVDSWKNRCSKYGKESYKTLPGDILVLTDIKPETVSDLQRVGRTWTFASVTKIREDEDEDGNDTSSTNFRVNVSKDIQVDDEMKNSLFLIFLVNITTNRRIWNSLRIDQNSNLKIIKEVLCTNSMVEENCELCSMQNEGICDEQFGLSFSSALNESQAEAVFACLRRVHCDHKSAVELIWGPPGTGKTKTVSMLLFTLLKMKCRTLLCAPTNVAVKEMASRVLKMLKESAVTDSGRDTPFCSLGDIVLFGNKERLKVGAEIEEIYIDYRVKRLAECFAPLRGWRHCFGAMIGLLEDCASQYQNELMKEREKNTEKEIKEKEDMNGTEGSMVECKSFLEFVRETFRNIAAPLRDCIFILHRHVPKSYILEKNFQDMVTLNSLLDSFETLLFRDNLVSKELEEVFSLPVVEDFSQPVPSKKYLLHKMRIELHSVISILFGSLKDLDLPFLTNKGSLRDFCFQKASLILCTASSSYSLHSVAMEPLTFLVIDEAAQLKESESAIPLQLRGVKHAVLIVMSANCQQWLKALYVDVSAEAGFGRSLFERLSSLGHSKHLLNIQYRMHPEISLFPNSNFYQNQILDSPIVNRKSYEKDYLSGPMFGPYSFINIFGGREEFIDHSCRNMVEVAALMKILRNLHETWSVSKQKLSIGVISPYTAQVVAIQDRLGDKYEKIDGFSVKVKSVDGFQGGEEDIIIISTVRSNAGGSIGFISNPQRINVALTRARHCLWILGNERTLTRSESVWEALVQDAKHRRCCFNADEDKDLAKAILEVKKEFDELDDLLNPESIIFRNQKWKVIFSDNFLKSFRKLTSVQTKKSVINLLLKLARGWRPKKRNIDLVCGSSMHVTKQFKVEGLYIVCSVDIVKEEQYIQVLKVWDILPLEEVPQLVKRLESIFIRYTEDYISRCKEKCLEGNLEVPKTWVASSDIIRVKNISNESRSDLSGSDTDGRSYLENSKVSESLLLMKFYSLSSGVVTHLLSDRDGEELDLPFEVTDEELEIILFPRSTFILGRSGTGKTTVLTMKLFQNEKLHQIAIERRYGADSRTHMHISQEKEIEGTEESKRPILHQLFVTVSPKLCFAVKQHISHLKSSAFGGKLPAECRLIDVDHIDNAAQFKDIPNSFVDIPSKLYPLVITFQKFLIMLDGTLGTSYFNRIHGIRMHSDGQIQSLKSVALETFVRTKEVNYDRFSSLYWPHFNTQLTKKLDSSRVFTEIISHIKGGLRALEVDDGKLGQEDYIQLSESRGSTLRSDKRKMIYEIYENYERMKADNGDFDLADLVIDIHRRLKVEKFAGHEMDFVYIDEVQDLTMSQIALFKYICRNVEKGFVFSGDTAQTIARGIDFRFQDIKSLFYKKFLLESSNNGHDGSNNKGKLSEIFSLSQNFRTHAGVLKLAQSIIDLLYRFFPLAIDILKPEISLIYGEAPVLLESENNENAIITIFGNSGNVSGNMVGFGAQQVILVRDDCARKEISKYVGKQALVLTIVECKGLEFQDVLLYNFFSSSPLKNKWRLIYQYMMEQELLDSKLSYPSFSEAKHNVLCSELKQLYVAITRTRQRLWIWENEEELCKPMYDYWKKKCLVQVRQLDDSLAQTMQVTSSPEEWRSQGMKLLYEHNYEMATMCFERAGDVYWERRSKAAGLTAAADRIRSTNPEEATIILREAAEIYEAIGKFDSAAKCFYDLGEFKRAGMIYLNKCGESELERAGECFSLAGCYELAASVYARGYYFSECLGVCSKGKLFDMGLQCIHSWKQHADTDVGLDRRSQEINQIEQDFLESCAVHYLVLKDNKSMMKFVKAFHSMDLMRNFLTSKNCLDELLLLEEESGNFVEAANIAKLRGDILLAADLLQKAGNYKEASQLTLSYVFSNSLWSHGSKGWPLKHFKQKEELLEKAKSSAKNDSNQFYEFVCTEADILSNVQCNLYMLNQQFIASKRHLSITGEILSARKILDFHLHLNSSKYGWEDELVLYARMYSDEKICKNHVSVETLVYFWNYWKNKILNIFEYLGCLKTPDVGNYRSYGDFCLSYLGVWKQCESQCNKLDAIYFLLNSDADWVRESDNRNAQSRGKLVSIDIDQLVSAAWSYWSSELLSVGLKVLDSLEAHHKQSEKKMSMFCRIRSLTYIYEGAKFLLDSKCLHLRYHEGKTLQKFVDLSTEQFFGYIFPLDWRQSLSKNVISLRVTEVCRSIVEEVILKCTGLKNKLSYGQIGTMAVMILGSGKLQNGLYDKVAKRCCENFAWNAFLVNLSGNIGLESAQGNNNHEFRMLSLVHKFHGALLDTFEANWRIFDYISPSCLLYLIERLLILLSCFQGYVITTQSSFVDWVIHEEGNINPILRCATDVRQSFGGVLDSVIRIVQQLLYKINDTMEWIKKSHRSNANECYSLVVLRLVVIICLLRLNFGNSVNFLFDFLGWNYLTRQLPRELCDVLRRIQKRNFVNANVNVMSEAFKKIGNPLVFVNLGGNCSKFTCSDAIFVDLKITQSKEDILEILFPKNEASEGHAEATKLEAANTYSEVRSSDYKDQGKSSSHPTSNPTCLPGHDLHIKNVNEDKQMMSVVEFWKIFEVLKYLDRKSIVSNAPAIKVDLEKSISLLTAALEGSFLNTSYNGENQYQLLGSMAMLEELKELLGALDSEPKHKNSISTIIELSKSLLSRRPSVEPVLNKLLFLQYGNLEEGQTSVETGIVSGDNCVDENSDSKSEEYCSGLEKGEEIKASPAATIGSGTKDNSQETKNKGSKKNKSKKNNKKGKNNRKK